MHVLYLFRKNLVDHPLLLDDAQTDKLLRGDLNCVGGTTATRDILDRDL